MLTFLKAIISGLSTGLVISIPLGPAGIESIKRTINENYKKGLFVSFGAICADISYLFLINCGLFNYFNKNQKSKALFWIFSGITLLTIEYFSLTKHTKKSKLLNNNKINSSPFLSGFLITFSNPMTPSLWITLSGTIIRKWHYIGKTSYYIFICSIISGMILWFVTLNYLALKGVHILGEKVTKKTSKILNLIILTIGIIFIVLGFIKLFNESTIAYRSSIKYLL
ncbi:LysE family translocator [Clostridium rectalis]|uniref:LysE family translocator n=1 Tax=Clostridium rectalis TaxID=2040295 RepID=UPI000F631FDD|nr:LysE family transporter [Clostridium rectalis]